MGVNLLGKVKIHEIAKKLGLTSKEVLDAANKFKIEVKSHLSGVEEHEAKKIENILTKKEEKSKEEPKKEKEKEVKKEEKAPVIIRREVIIAQEEQEKKMEIVKKEEKKTNVGFVERKQNKDYNIVYRNKPNKPMTVSELFGLKKEEPKQEEPVVKEEKIEKIETVKIQQPKEEPTKVLSDNTIKPRTQERTLEPKKENKDNRNNNYNNNNRNRNRNQNNNYRNDNFNRNRNDNFNKNHNDNNRGNHYNNGNNRFNNNRNNGDRFGKKPLDEKGIEKNIKNIMAVETIEKETVREYNRGLDKQKNNKFDENKTAKKTKTRRNNTGNDFDEGKLKTLKQANRFIQYV